MSACCSEEFIWSARRMPRFREYRRPCTINGSWITWRLVTAPESRLLPRCKKPLVIGTSTPASERSSIYPDQLKPGSSKLLLWRGRSSFLSRAFRGRVLRQRLRQKQHCSAEKQRVRHIIQPFDQRSSP